jgi:hypothetical protein
LLTVFLWYGLAALFPPGTVPLLHGLPQVVKSKEQEGVENGEYGVVGLDSGGIGDRHFDWRSGDAVEWCFGDE